MKLKKIKTTAPFTSGLRVRWWLFWATNVKYNVRTLNFTPFVKALKSWHEIWYLEWRGCELWKYKFQWRYDSRSGSCNTVMIISSFKFVFSQFTSSSFYVSFLLWVKINSTNLPAPNLWVFITQLIEHCSTNAEARGLNPVEVPNYYYYFFLGGGGGGVNLQLLKLQLPLWRSYLHLNKTLITIWGKDYLLFNIFKPLPAL